MDTFSLAEGRFRVLEKLGEGGTATVYLAHDVRARRRCAVKLLRPEYARLDEIKRRLHREARTMASLRHRHIVEVIAAGDEARGAWIAMAHAERGSVGDWVDAHGPLPTEALVAIGIEVCSAVAYAHDQGVIHRDLKPQNLLVDAAGRVLVADFGIAQITGLTQRWTKTGAALGTIGFIAPEQLDSAKHVDEGADIYGLAATLVSLGTGRHPLDLFMRRATDPPFASLAPVLAAVLTRATRHRRQQRHESMGDLLEDLIAVRERLTPDAEGTISLLRAEQAGLPPPVPAALREASLAVDTLGVVKQRED